MRNLAEININEGGRPPKRPAPTDALFAEFEHANGIEFPESLKALLRFANGGHPELDAVGGQQGQFSVNRFYHLTADDDGPESMSFAFRHWREILGRNAIPFASDGGGNQFFLDTSVEPPSVKICLHGSEMQIIPIARSLDDFIDSLEIDPDMI